MEPLRRSWPSKQRPEAQKHVQDGALCALRDTGDLQGREKKLHQVVARLKYTWIEQRTTAHEKRSSRAHEAQCISGHEICQLSAKDMCVFAKQCRLFDDVQGAACKHPKCGNYADKYATFSDTGILGPLRAALKTARGGCLCIRARGRSQRFTWGERKTW